MKSISAGTFVTFDGPHGVGKTTIIQRIAHRLRDAGLPHFCTAEPSDSQLGRLTRDGTYEYHGLSLACLVAADRYDHIQKTLQPHLAAGEIVLCDRYLASSLVLQGMDAVDPPFVLALHEHALRPDVSVIVRADLDVLLARRANRAKPLRRFEKREDSSKIEAQLFARVAQTLRDLHLTVIEVDASSDDSVGLVNEITELVIRTFKSRPSI